MSLLIELDYVTLFMHYLFDWLIINYQCKTLVGTNVYTYNGVYNVEVLYLSILLNTTFYILQQQQSRTPSSVRRAQLKEQLLSSPLYKPVKTMFISQPEKVTFLAQSSQICSVGTDEGDIDSLELTESSPHHSPEPGSHAGTQTNSRGTQTNAGSFLIVPSYTDQCLFTDLNQSYLCQHRTLARSMKRELDNVRIEPVLH